MSVPRQTRRWRGVVGVALVTVAVGLLANRPKLLLVATVVVAFAAYPRLTRAPSPALELDRRLDEQSPKPGDEVTVDVTLRNAGGNVLPDVRVVDGVPAALGVTDGTPRHGTSLPPGGEAEFSYAVTVEEGTHEFEPATVVVRDPSGEHEFETSVSAATEIRADADFQRPPHRDLTVAQSGRILADREGTGVEFFQTREYRPGDDVSRIDWNRYARSGELTTIEFNEQAAGSVVLLVDAREPAYRGDGESPHAVVRSVAAARQLADALLGRRFLVGAAGVGREYCWLSPAAGSEQRDRIEDLLATHAAFSATPPERDVPLADQMEQLREAVEHGTQFVVLSPLCDDAIVDAVRRLDAHGYLVSVVSPDVTGTETTGQRLASTERRNRIATLRSADVPVVDWPMDQPLGTAVELAGSEVAR
jgi:uncharacterized repeat protein (TIGR01451 family)